MRIGIMKNKNYGRGGRLSSQGNQQLLSTVQQFRPGRMPSAISTSSGFSASSRLDRTPMVSPSVPLSFTPQAPISSIPQATPTSSSSQDESVDMDALRQQLVDEYMDLINVYIQDNSLAQAVSKKYEELVARGIYSDDELAQMRSVAEQVSANHDLVQQQESGVTAMKAEEYYGKNPFTAEQIKQVAYRYYHKMEQDTAGYPVANDRYITALVERGSLTPEGYALFQQEVAALHAAEQTPVHTATNVVPENVQQLSTLGPLPQKEWYERTRNQVFMGLALLALAYATPKLLK